MLEIENIHIAEIIMPAGIVKKIGFFLDGTLIQLSIEQKLKWPVMWSPLVVD